MDLNDCIQHVDSCGKEMFCDITLNQCASCFSLCRDIHKTEERCQTLCPDYVLDGKQQNGRVPTQNSTSISNELKEESLQLKIIIPLAVLSVVMIVIIVVLFLKQKSRVAEKRLSETKSTQAYETRSVNDENGYENHPMKGCHYVTNGNSFSINLGELSFPQQCSEDYSQPPCNIHRDIHGDMAGIPEDHHSDSMLSTNAGSMKPPFKLKDNIRPLDQCEYVQDSTSSSMIVPTQSSTFPKFKGQNNDEAHSAPAMNINARMQAHEKYHQHKNDRNPHDLQSKAENRPLMKDMATGTEVPNSVIDIPPPFQRNISLERQHSHSSPGPNEVTEIRPLLLPSPESQHILLVSDVEPQYLMMPYIMPYDNQQEPSPNRDADEPVTGTESGNLDLRADSFRSGTAEAADFRTDRSNVTTLADRRQRWEMVMRMNDAVNAKRLSFVAGCRMSDEALQVFVRPTPDLDLPACYRQILNAVPRDAPEHMLVVDVESTPII